MGLGVGALGLGVLVCLPLRLLCPILSPYYRVSCFAVLYRANSEDSQTLVLWHRMQSFYFLSSPRRNGPAVYTQHNALVRGLATTSSSNTANNFLEWEPEDGWEPLCKFLGVEVPQEEFPNMNQTEAFRETVDWYFKSRLQRAVRNLVGFVVLVCVVVGVWMWDYARVSDLVVG